VGLSIRNIDDVDSRRKYFYIPEIKEQIVLPLRETAPEVPLVLGGSAVSVAPRLILKQLGADMAVMGDGERAAIALFKALAAGEDTKNICGVISADDSENCQEGSPDRIEDLMEYPHSKAYKWIDVKRYAEYGTRYGIQTKRGCDRSCTYCSYPRIEGTTYRLFDPVSIVDEIAEAYEKSGIDLFEFVDSTFNIPREHCMAVLKELANRKLPVKLDTMGLNPIAVDAELLKAMKDAGFNESSCTPESGSIRMIKSLGKQFTLEQIANAAKVLKEANMPTKWYFMFGAPGENEETIKETFAFIDDHIPPSDLVIVMTGIRVLPGTPLEITCRKKGMITEDNSLLEPFFIYGDLSRERLQDLVAIEINKRPKCCHASGELFNQPFIMRSLFLIFKTLGIKSTGWAVLRLGNMIRKLWRPTKG
jgi:radical SAM superfamily enzyme YgiQ (UPF0313 family)